MKQILHKVLSFEVVGAAMELHRTGSLEHRRVVNSVKRDAYSAN